MPLINGSSLSASKSTSSHALKLYSSCEHCMRTPKPVTRSQSLSDCWTHDGKHHQPIRCSHRHHQPITSSHSNYHPINCHQKQLDKRKLTISHSAPVIIQPFEETLLPTHNIFFAGRPPSPKIPKIEKAVCVETLTSVLSTTKKTKPGAKKVKFVDEVNRSNYDNGKSAVLVN